AATATAGLRRTKRVAILPPVWSAASAAPVSTHFSCAARDGSVASRLFMVGVLGNADASVGMRAFAACVGAPLQRAVVQVPRGLARCVAVADHGSSGQGCRG